MAGTKKTLKTLPLDCRQALNIIKILPIIFVIGYRAQYRQTYLQFFPTLKAPTRVPCSVR
jgi:hypothetical protein